MEQAIRKLQSLPDIQQDQVARFLLNELQEDDRWISSTANSSAKLEGLVDRVLTDDAKGNTEPLDPDKL